MTATDHAYKAIRPADSATSGPAILLDGANADDLNYALSVGATEWPNCSIWDLVGADDFVIRLNPAWPAGMRSLRNPVDLARFETIET